MALRLNPENRDLESKLQRLSVRQFGLAHARCNRVRLSGHTNSETVETDAGDAGQPAMR